MPKQIVEIELTAEIADRPQETFTDAAIVGTAEEEPPDAEFGEVNQYSTSTSVGDDYGEDSDVYTASEAIEEMGAEQWRVMVLEATEVTEEELSDGDTIDKVPILGNHEVESPDGDIEFTTDDDPDVEDFDAEIVINSATGDVATSEDSIELTYFHADWSQLDEFPSDVNNFAVADRRFDLKGVGVLDETHSWASDEDMGMIANGVNVDDYDSVDEAMDVAHEVAGYVPSGDLMMIVDASDDDLAAYQLGKFAVSEPWYNPLWNELPAGETVSKNVGDPEEQGTFEGGDEAEGEGPVNVLIDVSDANRVSNAVTTAGADSDTSFFDIRRTKVYTAEMLELDLESLQVSDDDVPFTEDGQAMIEDAIKGTMSGLTGSVGQPLAEYEVDVPEWDDDDVDRVNRNWGGIDLDARLAQRAHTFSLGLNVSV
ncbi:head protein [Natrialba phage PhiCh1]|uniref:Capsid protein CP67 n=2 Tax=root TaxID=1 RepID=D3T2G6_NATMM|nr:hypothetical protein [Natrialba magadii]NP_665936.1 head protein [Natrialba phage PhiCh1]YP_010078048.1 head protein [Natrialba phage PhiCh1]AAM88692.1 capsid protein CP67 [Natrialba phage PhiCh1]ADD07775.1 capsid protein CP67 [Natrialba magadii ATCC 43099]ELY23022.1 hypothetical protein C500_21200 [Natrialba magadii ATCC 43099]QBJ01199.1 tail sheath protein [Natrialba phage PhiCh1]